MLCVKDVALKALLYPHSNSKDQGIREKKPHVTEKVVVELYLFFFNGRFVFIPNFVTGIVTRGKAV